MTQLTAAAKTIRVFDEKTASTAGASAFALDLANAGTRHAHVAGLHRDFEAGHMTEHDYDRELARVSRLAVTRA